MGSTYEVAEPVVILLHLLLLGELQLALDPIHLQHRCMGGLLRISCVSVCVCACEEQCETFLCACEEKSETFFPRGEVRDIPPRVEKSETFLPVWRSVRHSSLYGEM